MPKKYVHPAKQAQPEPASEPLPSMGVAPAVLAQRYVQNQDWCPTKNIDFDPYCDPENPKTITYKDVLRAAKKIKDIVPRTPLWNVDPHYQNTYNWLQKSRYCKRFKLDIYYKLENFNRSGSFYDRGAAYVMKTLSTEQKYRGVITASLGNWGKALAYHGKKNDVRVTIVLPQDTKVNVLDKCKEFRATVIQHGANLAEAKHHAFELIQENHCTYINSYDYPAVIAANGTIGLEIMEELPATNVIIAPVGGGALIAGLVASMQSGGHQSVAIIGVQPDKSCCMFKALDNEKVYETEVGDSIATSLAVSKAGYNAFQTAQPGIKRMFGSINLGGSNGSKVWEIFDQILVDDDWIARAMLHLIEEENLVVEGAGATSLSPLFAVPQILAELRFQNVVCVISGGNINIMSIPRAIERGKIVDGRLIKFTMVLNWDDIKEQLRVMSIISNVGCNVVSCRVETLIDNMDARLVHFKLVCETKSMEQTCTLKRVMESLFPNKCRFVQEPFSPIPICVCFPKKKR